MTDKEARRQMQSYGTLAEKMKTHDLVVGEIKYPSKPAEPLPVIDYSDFIIGLGESKSPTLEAIIRDLTLRCGIPNGDLNCSSLREPIIGHASIRGNKFTAVIFDEFEFE